MCLHLSDLYDIYQLKKATIARIQRAKQQKSNIIHIWNLETSTPETEITANFDGVAAHQTVVQFKNN